MIATRPINYDSIKYLNASTLNRDYLLAHVQLQFKCCDTDFTEEVKKISNGKFSDLNTYLKAHGFTLFLNPTKPKWRVIVGDYLVNTRTDSGNNAFVYEVLKIFYNVCPFYEALEPPEINILPLSKYVHRYEELTVGGWVVGLTNFVTRLGYNALMYEKYIDAHGKEVSIPICSSSKKDLMRIVSAYNDCIGVMPKLKKLDKDSYLFYNKHHGFYKPDRCGIIYRVTERNLSLLKQFDKEFHDECH